jgi:hypothetical protein
MQYKKTAPIPPETGKAAEGDSTTHAVHAIVSVGIATMNMLENLLPTAAGEVEHESKNLSENFINLVTILEEQNRIIGLLLGEKAESELERKRLEHQADKTMEQADGLAKNVVMGMQFQDRNSQVMQNVAGILERYRIMLEDIRSNIEAAHDGHMPSGQTLEQAVEQILSTIRLGDIRARYIEALSKARVHEHKDADAGTASGNNNDDIELF